jgi:hypothetical protein
MNSPLRGEARWPPKRLTLILHFNLHNSYFILALPPGGATGGGEKSGAFIHSHDALFGAYAQAQPDGVKRQRATANKAIMQYAGLPSL